MGCDIYCIVNIVNDKKYIGQTCDLLSRWSRHKYELLRNIHKNKMLQVDFNIHRLDNFECRVIEHCGEDVNVDERERYWIEKYQTNIYNMQTGGKKEYKVSDESRKRMSESLKGKKRSPETKQKLSIINKGKTLSHEHKKKMSEAHKGNGHTHTIETRKKISATKLTPITDQMINDVQKGMTKRQFRGTHGYGKHIWRRIKKVYIYGVA